MSGLDYLWTILSVIGIGGFVVVLIRRELKRPTEYYDFEVERLADKIWRENPSTPRYEAYRLAKHHIYAKHND